MPKATARRRRETEWPSKAVVEAELAAAPPARQKGSAVQIAPFGQRNRRAFRRTRQKGPPFPFPSLIRPKPPPTKDWQGLKPLPKNTSKA